MRSAEKVLVVLLRANAAVLVVALVPAVMPFAWMETVHRWLGLGDLPGGPIVGYLTRSCSLLYAAHGVLLFYLSLDVRRHLSIIGFLATLGLVFGAAMFLLDWSVGMPLRWVVGEGPFIAAVAAVLLWLVHRAKRARNEEGPESRPQTNKKATQELQP